MSSRTAARPDTTPPGGRVGALVAEADAGALPRTLGRWDLVVLGVGAMVGGGVFILTGLVAGNDAGPAVVVAYLVAAAVCAIAAASYAELATLMPLAGSAYSYAYASMGELAGWLFAWVLMLEYALGAALVGLGGAGYALSFGRSVGLVAPAGAEAAVAALAIALAGALLTLGVRPSAYATGVLVLVKVAAIALFVAFGLPFVSPRHWVPFVPPADGAGHFGWAGLGRATALVFFAYAGFDAVATAAQEARSPRRDLPAGILGSLAIAALLYVTVALVLTGLVPYGRLGTTTIGDALGDVGLAWVRVLVDIAVLAGLASVLLVLLLAQTRVLFAMARDGLLPRALARVSRRSGSPWAATLATTFAVAFAAALLPLRALGEVVSAAVLVSYAGVCLAVVLLRRSAPERTRAFKVPLAPALPLAGAAACVALLFVLPTGALVQLGLWLALGLLAHAARRLAVRLHPPGA